MNKKFVIYIFSGVLIPFILYVIYLNVGNILVPDRAQDHTIGIKDM